MFSGEVHGTYADGGAVWGFVAELMFRCGVSYSGWESCQEDGLVVDEYVGVLDREEVKEVAFCNGLSSSSELYIVVARGGFFLGLSCVGFYELAKDLFSICGGGVVDGVVTCLALGCCCEYGVLA